MIVYDATNRESFNKLEDLIIQAKTAINDNTLIFIWANKTDLCSKRVISFEEGIEIASKCDAYFIETSAKDGSSIEFLFTLICGILIDCV